MKTLVLSFLQIVFFALIGIGLVFAYAYSELLYVGCVFLISFILCFRVRRGIIKIYQDLFDEMGITQKYHGWKTKHKIAVNLPKPFFSLINKLGLW